MKITAVTTFVVRMPLVIAGDAPPDRRPGPHRNVNTAGTRRHLDEAQMIQTARDAATQLKELFEADAIGPQVGFPQAGK